MNNKFFKILILSFLSFVFYTNNSFAAELLLNIKDDFVNQKSFYIDISVDTKGESINAVSSNFYFDDSYMSFSGFDNEKSSIVIWAQIPKETSRGIVSFSGAIPGGIDRLYDPLNPKKTEFTVVRLLFNAKNFGNTSVSLKDSLILKNDGVGTKIKNNDISKEILIKKEILQNESLDIQEPLPFIISIIEKSFFGRTPRLAVFSTTDDSGGIKKYEASFGGEFREVSSPISIPNKIFPYKLTIRAYDYSDNFREQQITIKSSKMYVFALILFIIILGLWIFGKRLYNIFKNK